MNNKNAIIMHNNPDYDGLLWITMNSDQYCGSLWIMI